MLLKSQWPQLQCLFLILKSPFVKNAIDLFSFYKLVTSTELILNFVIMGITLFYRSIIAIPSLPPLLLRQTERNKVTMQTHSLVKDRAC